MQNAAVQPVDISEAEEIRKFGGAFRTISEVATELGVQQHVLRFWETKFNQIRPMKRGGGRRYYRPEDVTLLKHIHTLLYSEGYTIKGAQKLLKGQTKGAIAAAQAASEAADKARTTAQNAGPITSVQAPVATTKQPVQVVESVKAAAPQQVQASPLPAVVVDALQGMLDDLRELRALVGQQAA